MPFPVFHGLLPSLHRHRAPAGGGRSPLGAAVAARSLGPALRPLPAGAALRGAGAGAGVAGRHRRVGDVVGVSAQGKPTRQPRSGAVGQWAGAVRIGGVAEAGSPGLRSPERVWTLRALPLESLPAALTVKGAGGEKQPGRTPTLVLSVSGWLLFRKAARAFCGLLIHEPPRSSWASRPPPQPMRATEGGWVERHEKSSEASAAPSRSSQQPASQQPGQNQQPKGQGP